MGEDDEEVHGPTVTWLGITCSIPYALGHRGMFTCRLCNSAWGTHIPEGCDDVSLTGRL